MSYNHSKDTEWPNSQISFCSFCSLNQASDFFSYGVILTALTNY